MVTKAVNTRETPTVRILRIAQVLPKLVVSEAKLFDMIAKGLFPKPFPIVPGGRAVGWLEEDVDAWILERKRASQAGSQ